MNKKQFPWETFFYLLALVLALSVRLINLGAAPLSDIEAVPALQALDLLGTTAADIAPQPAYLSLTGMTFALLGSSDFLARLWPALAGSLILLVPFLLRERLGRKVALFLAFGLALDPGLVALSRSVGGTAMAVGFVALALTMFYLRKPAWSGIFTGLALLSGPAVWPGLLGLGIGWGGVHLFGLPQEMDDEPTTESTLPWAGFSVSEWKTWLLFAAGSLFLVGTLFFTFPLGLGALGKSLASFLRGWADPGGVPPGRLLVTLLVYAPLALIFALVAVARRGWRNRWLLWALAALIVALIYPARQVGDIVWVIVPLWVLAAQALASNFRDGFWKHPVSWAQAGAIFILMALIWLTLAGMRATPVDGRLVRWLLVAGILLLGTLTVIFIGLGWAWDVARSGAVLGLLASLGVYTVAAMVGATQVRPGSVTALWYPPPATGQARLMLDTLEDLSLRETGMKHALDGVVLVESPALRWALRDFSGMTHRTALGEEPLPPVVIAPVGSETEAWAAAYRGQDFVWRIRPAWQGSLPPNWINWLVFRDTPIDSEYIILWARGDLFPGEGDQTQEESPQLEDDSGEQE
jgi:hypothetical protein